MKRDLFNELKRDIEIIFVNWDIDIDFNDDDEMDDFVYIDLNDHRHIDTEDKHTIITYNYLLQMKASTSKYIDFIVEILDDEPSRVGILDDEPSNEK